MGTSQARLPALGLLNFSLKQDVLPCLANCNEFEMAAGCLNADADSDRTEMTVDAQAWQATHKGVDSNAFEECPQQCLLKALASAMPESDVIPERHTACLKAWMCQHSQHDSSGM